MYFQRCVNYVDIAGLSSARGLQSEYSGRKWRFSSVWQTVSNTVTVTISHQQEIAFRFFVRGLHARTAVAHLPCVS